MAQVKLLKIATDGVPVEFGTADDITLNSFTAGAAGPSLSPTSLAMASQPISGAGNLSFQSASTNGITQTAGLLAADNIVGKERSNVMTTAGELLFPVITDTPSTVDNFRVPQIAGVPTATPTNAGAGYMVFDSTDNRLYVWSGSAWVDQTTITGSLSVANSYTAAATIAARDVVYISAADSVTSAIATAATTSQAVGFAVAGAAATAAVSVQENGLMSGFSALTAGARYYLSAATAGAITPTIPAGSGNTIVQVGYAKSATQMAIRIENMGRRA